MVVVGVSLGVLLGVAAVVSALQDNGVVRSPAACVALAALVPYEVPGPPWVQHHHWLVLDEPTDPVAVQTPLLRERTAYVENGRTGQVFKVKYGLLAPTTYRFFLRSRYTDLLNRRWQTDPWSLCRLVFPEPPTPQSDARGSQPRWLL